MVKKTQVLKIYNYLYKFSLEKLQKLINNPALVLLFARYIQLNGRSRIEKSDNMGKYREAYLEACHIMINESKHASKIKAIPELNFKLIECSGSNEDSGASMN